MNVFEHETQAMEAWRDGVMTLMRVSALVQSAQLCIFEQFCEPGSVLRSIFTPSRRFSR